MLGVPGSAGLHVGARHISNGIRLSHSDASRRARCRRPTVTSPIHAVADRRTKAMAYGWTAADARQRGVGRVASHGSKASRRRVVVSGLGAGDVETDNTFPGTGWPARRSRDRAACRIAVTRHRTVMPGRWRWRPAAVGEAGQHGVGDRVKRQPAVDMQFGREPETAYDVVGRQVFDAFVGHPAGPPVSASTDRVRERFQAHRDPVRGGAEPSPLVDAGSGSSS
jgi:hypothetical protein